MAWSLPGEPGAKPTRDTNSRFGVEAVENDGDGVLVIRVWPDYPGTTRDRRQHGKGCRSTAAT